MRKNKHKEDQLSGAVGIFVGFIMSIGILAIGIVLVVSLMGLPLGY